MKEINVYERYFAADATFHGVKRRAVNLQLVATSDAGEVFYRIVLSFFPFETPDDFRVSWDACFEKEIYRAKGRRSKKREEEFLSGLHDAAEKLAREHGAVIDFNRPLIAERRG